MFKLNQIAKDIREGFKHVVEAQRVVQVHVRSAGPSGREQQRQRPPSPAREVRREHRVPSVNLDKEVSDALEAHNRARRAAPVNGRTRRTPLRWSRTLSKAAQAYAEEMARTDKWGHSDRATRPGQGENLYFQKGYGRVPLKAAVDSWNAEKHAASHQQQRTAPAQPSNGHTDSPPPPNPTPSTSPLPTHGATPQNTRVQTKAKTSTVAKAADQKPHSLLR
ncbi:hypothetical protein G7Y89_g9356 [Cudoniella acicularis]|uniref:SCP domain-containing protein n=1 Tax=Cudoniella acicularis TaxID=354080 RepID=A0A8H4RH49_9HELO|nr:hypothetical protein G7Y89_g9356 [Cudoniella acicularis]